MHPCREKMWLIIYPESVRDVISIPLNINLAVKHNTALFEKHINCFHWSNKDAPCREKLWLIIYPEFVRDVILIPLNTNLAVKHNTAWFEKHINCFHWSNKDAPCREKLANYLPRVCYVMLFHPL